MYFTMRFNQIFKMLIIIKSSKLSINWNYGIHRRNRTIVLKSRFTTFTTSEVRKSHGLHTLIHLMQIIRMSFTWVKISDLEQEYSRLLVCSLTFVMSSIPNWTVGLHSISPHYFCGVVDDAESLLEKHKIETQSLALECHRKASV